LISKNARRVSRFVRELIRVGLCVADVLTSESAFAFTNSKHHCDGKYFEAAELVDAAMEKYGTLY